MWLTMNQKNVHFHIWPLKYSVTTSDPNYLHRQMQKTSWKALRTYKTEGTWVPKWKEHGIWLSTLDWIDFQWKIKLWILIWLIWFNLKLNLIWELSASTMVCSDSIKINLIFWFLKVQISNKMNHRANAEQEAFRFLQELNIFGQLLECWQ